MELGWKAGCRYVWLQNIVGHTLLDDIFDTLNCASEAYSKAIQKLGTVVI